MNITLEEAIALQNEYYNSDRNYYTAEEYAEYLHYEWERATHP